MRRLTVSRACALVLVLVAGLEACAGESEEQETGRVSSRLGADAMAALDATDDGSAPIDAGVIDADVIDADVIDASVIDASVVDAGVVDSGGPVDAGPVDSGAVDSGGPVDAGPVDSGAVDSGQLGDAAIGADAATVPIEAGKPGATDAGTPTGVAPPSAAPGSSSGLYFTPSGTQDDGGCTTVQGSLETGSASLLGLALVAFAGLRRRRRD